MAVKAARQHIMLAKTVDSASSASVVWLSIDPFESTNVEWEEEYGIYASTTVVAEGAIIAKLSEVEFPASDGKYYSFTSSGMFLGPYSGPLAPPQGTFMVINDMPSSTYSILTFGLTQSALVNQLLFERKPVSATAMLAAQQIMMTPLSNVYIWLQSYYESQAIITKVVSRYALAKFSRDVNKLTFKYDAGSGEFNQVNE